MLPPPSHLPQDDRGDHPTPKQAEIRRSGRSPSVGPQTEEHFDTRPCLELPRLGFSSQAPSIHEAIPVAPRAHQGDHNPIVPVSLSGRLNPLLLSLKTDKSGSNPRRCTNNDPMAPGHQSQELGLDPIFRDHNYVKWKRNRTINPSSPPTHRPAKIPTCYSHCPPCTTLMHRFLQVRLHNPLNVCYINATMLGQLWATLAFEDFDPKWDQ